MVTYSSLFEVSDFLLDDDQGLLDELGLLGRRLDSTTLLLLLGLLTSAAFLLLASLLLRHGLGSGLGQLVCQGASWCCCCARHLVSIVSFIKVFLSRF